MLLAPISLIARYASLHPLLPTAFEWLAEHRWTASVGRHAIVGDDLYVTVDEGWTEPAEKRRFESHRRYADVQVALSGGEMIEWAPADSLTLQTDFRPDGDVAFYLPPFVEPTRLRLEPGRFALFFPGEAHRTRCALDGRVAPYRKMVFKLACRAE